MFSSFLQSNAFHFLSETGIVAKLVLLILLTLSIFCWAIIIAKWKTFRKLVTQNEKFFQFFWSNIHIEELSNQVDQLKDSSLAHIFQYAIQELQRLTENPHMSSMDKVDNIQRALARSIASETTQLERHINWLATTASVAPFIGLFGTVWGIMNAFQAMGVTQGANLTVISSGISEALITTAAGIATAIPAAIGYYYCGGLIKKIANDLECFSQDFMNMIQRNLSQNQGN